MQDELPIAKLPRLPLCLECRPSLLGFFETFSSEGYTRKGKCPWLYKRMLEGLGSIQGWQCCDKGRECLHS
jgi:hypothetical protein